MAVGGSGSGDAAACTALISDELGVELALLVAGVYPDAMIRTARGDQFGLAHLRGVFVRGQTRYITAVIRVVDYSGAGVGAALSL